MFIKETYARRIKREEDQDNQGKLLTKKITTQKIGSIKNNKINYDREQQFFSKEDIPSKAFTIKQEVKDFIDPDFLGLRKKPWNSSVSVPHNIEDEESHERKLIKIRHGLFNSSIPASSDPIIYEGTETRDDYTGWQVSTQVTKKQLEDNYKKINSNAHNHTKSVQKQYLTQYLNPLQKSRNLIQSQKQKKITQNELRSTLREQYKYVNPNASQQKTNAAVFRLAYQTGLSVLKNNLTANQTTQSQKPFKASLTQSLKQKVLSKQFHNGIWQLFKIERREQVQEYYAWSCCMNQEYSNPGCVTKKVDGNKWNLTSFNS